MQLNQMFKKTKDNYIPLRGAEPAASQEKPEVPEGLVRKCNKCGKAILTDEVKEHFYICPKCGGYFRMPAYRRIRMIAEPDSFEEWDTGMDTNNPLQYKGYEEKLAALREKTGLDEAVITGKARIGAHNTVLAVMDGRFLMASMGEVVGEKICRAVERATKERLPVIIFTCSGGARMQEGLTSLMQMAKTSAALKRHSDAGLLYVSVLTDPTTGGVTASFAMLGDLILAEPKALIGFAGQRVIEQTIGQKLPKGFQRSEFLLEHGFIDGIVTRERLKETLEQILKLHVKMPGQQISETGMPEEPISAGRMPEDHVSEEQVSASQVPEDQVSVSQIPEEQVSASQIPGKQLFREQIAEAERSEGSLCEKLISEKQLSDTDSDNKAWKNPGEMQKQKDALPLKSDLTAWERVQLSRKQGRPVGEHYINGLFEDFMELHGDRYFGDDKAVIGGIAMFRGMPVTVIAQAKGKNTKENIARNFGMPSPEGYRKALRLMKQAEKFHRPVICLVDTPGAFCGMEAEERGQGEAIARSLYEMSAMRTPILSLVIGEGGSGGALAFALADEVWMMENAVYSILSPEGYAAILWKDSTRAKEAAEVMKMTAADLKEAGLIEEVIAEPAEFTGETFSEVKDTLTAMLEAYLQEYCVMPTENLLEARYRRFRSI